MLRFLIYLGILVLSNVQLLAQNLDFKVKRTLNNNAKVECLILSKDGNTLISGDHAGNIKFWNIADGQLLFSFKAHAGTVNCISLSKTGAKLVSSGSDGKVKLWSVSGQKMINSYDSPYSSVNFVDISHDERTIFYGGYNPGGTNMGIFTGLCKIDVYSKKQLVLFDDEANSFTSSTWGITDGAIDPTGQIIIFTKGYNIYFWNIKENRMAMKQTSRFNLNNMLIAKDGNLYLWGEGMIILREKSSNYSAKYTAAGTYSSIDYYSHLNLSKSGKYLVTGSDKNNINIWAASSLVKQKTLTGHNGLVQVALFAKNDSILISGAYDGKIIFWENETPKVEEIPLVVKVEEQKPNEIATEVKNNNNNVVNNRKDTISAPAENPKSSNTVFADKNIPTSVYGRPVEMQSEITINKSKIDLKVWDEYSEDGDVISISLNGEWILQNYMLKKDAKIVSIDLKEGNNYLVLYAHNLGEVPPNSAAISTEVNKKEYKLTISSDLKTSGALNIIYKP